MNRHADTAAMLTALAEWVEDSLAGGDPPKWVARQAAEAVRAVAAEAGQAAADTGGWQVTDDVTVMIRRRPAGLQSGHRGWRVSRYIRRLMASAGTAVRGWTGD